MATKLVDVQNVDFSYPSLRTDSASPWHLQIARLSLSAGTLCLVAGQNMSGKTTLLRILAGLEAVSVRPSVSASSTISPHRWFARSRFRRLRIPHVCLLSHSDRMFPELTIWENVQVARSCGSVRDMAVARRSLENYLANARSLAGKTVDTPLGSLSSGGQALVRLARALAWKANLVLIDEVTAHLDDINANAFFGHLSGLLKAGCAIVLVSHVERDHKAATSLAQSLGRVPTRITIELKDNVSCVAAL